MTHRTGRDPIVLGLRLDSKLIKDFCNLTRVSSRTADEQSRPTQLTGCGTLTQVLFVKKKTIAFRIVWDARFLQAKLNLSGTKRYLAQSYVSISKI